MAEHYPFTLNPLPYAYNALEPYLSEAEVYAHHTQCEQNYVNLLNETLSYYPQFQDWSLKALVVYADTFPEEIRTDIKNYAGGVFNHQLYFSCMSEKRNTKPSGSLLREINATYGSFSNFESLLKSYALAIFGSGNTWVLFNSACKLQTINAPNQDTPPLSILNPLLLCDVWEHAYFREYRFDREKYIDNWLKLIDWTIISARYPCQ